MTAEKIRAVLDSVPVGSVALWRQWQFEDDLRNPTAADLWQAVGTKLPDGGWMDFAGGLVDWDDEIRQAVTSIDGQRSDTLHIIPADALQQYEVKQ